MVVARDEAASSRRSRAPGPISSSACNGTPSCSSSRSRSKRLFAALAAATQGSWSAPLKPHPSPVQDGLLSFGRRMKRYSVICRYTRPDAGSRRECGRFGLSGKCWGSRRPRIGAIRMAVVPGQARPSSSRIELKARLGGHTSMDTRFLPRRKCRQAAMMPSVPEGSKPVPRSTK